VVDAGIVKRVLQAVADAHPDEGAFAVTRLDISRGWGNLVNVTIYAAVNPARSAGHARAIRDAVEGALGTERFHVRLQEAG
jgi:hypothetical protein